MVQIRRIFTQKSISEAVAENIKIYPKAFQTCGRTDIQLGCQSSCATNKREEMSGKRIFVNNITISRG